MVHTEDLLNILEQKDIILDYMPLKDSRNGFYINSDGTDMIVMNPQVQHNQIAFRSTLAEEIGHYYTTVGDCTPYKDRDFQQQLKYEKAEYSAHRYAGELMISTDELLALVATLIPINMHSLAEAFMVDETIIQSKLRSMAAVKLIWFLANGKKLVLSNLPDVYLYEAF